jgi:aryl-alcohol dehydrogenase-like predicted oxidoreductase
MNSESISRRQFVERAALAAGAVALASASGSGSAAFADTAAPAAAGKRTVSDIVSLGNTGLKCSRLGLGLGSNNGAIQAAMGQDGFNAFVKHAFDQGITFLDTAQNYATFDMIAPAIKPLPREKLFIQSKIERPVNILDTIDHHRKTFDTDYVDSMLVHIQFRQNWTETWKHAMDEFDAAHDKKWIKSKGVSCHSLPALRKSIESDWTQVHLVRVNPQGVRIDSEKQTGWSDDINDVNAVLAEIKKIKARNRAVIGMKIFGNGEFQTDEDREKSARFAMSLPEIDAVIIGFAGIDELDSGIKMLDKVLAERA